jgi:hypothetical protein
VHAPQIDIGRERALGEHGQQVLRTRFQHRPVANQVERFFPHGGLPTVPGAAVLGTPGGVHDVLPGALEEGRIAGHQIGARDLQIHLGLTVGFVPRMEKAAGFVATAGAEAFLFAGVVVLDVVNARPAEESVLLLHTLPYQA